MRREDQTESVESETQGMLFDDDIPDTIDDASLDVAIEMMQAGWDDQCKLSDSFDTNRRLLMTGFTSIAAAMLYRFKTISGHETELSQLGFSFLFLETASSLLVLFFLLMTP